MPSTYMYDMDDQPCVPVCSGDLCLCYCNFNIKGAILMSKCIRIIFLKATFLLAEGNGELHDGTVVST